MRHFILVNLRSGRCARLCCVSMLMLMGAALLCSSCASSPSLTVNGPQGRLSTKVTLPAGFDTEKDSCMMVILMHGIFASKDWPPMPVLARELADARAVWEAVKALPYVSSVALLGHSQGGAVASMLAGELANEGEYPVGLVLLAPGSIIKEATQAGRFFGKEFDPKNPPAYIKCFNTYKLGHDYLVQTQLLDIYGTAQQYQGPVCLIHGVEDGIVPLWCSEKYHEVYANSQLHVVKGENHMFIKKGRKVAKMVAEFLRSEK